MRAQALLQLTLLLLAVIQTLGLEITELSKYPVERRDIVPFGKEHRIAVRIIYSLRTDAQKMSIQIRDDVCT